MKRTDDPKSQADKFRDLARELEAHADEARFEETVKKVVQSPKPASAYEKIKAGIEDAIAFNNGDHSRGRVHRPQTEAKKED